MASICGWGAAYYIEDQIFASDFRRELPSLRGCGSRWAAHARNCWHEYCRFISCRCDGRNAGMSFVLILYRFLKK